ncbi:hypothetical protein GCM10017608_29560 [Agromyces luteolus]|uniref:DUF4386 family protein n=1 Tax=Agromyces luteolus TaxID=88373 RepID=A0A7C9HIJ2_9MICO|nr:hypothetical protein [Agromyces luteolus]MUN06022.1 hypothetical protein [Agromyces luteolus]GLK29021.1 hypothetical protein GCM10017608_29560 [Agromyces luteolus]
MSTSRALPSVRRVLVAGSLVAAIATAVVGILLQPEFPDDPGEYVELLAGSASAAAGLQLFLWSQVFWAIGLVGLAHSASHRSPVLATLGAVFSGLGAFGHAAYGGASLVTLGMARYALESGDLDAAQAAFATTQGGDFIPYLLAGLAGTVLGVVLVAVALLRSAVAPRWVAIALLVWTVVEFVLPNVLSGAWITYASLVIGVIAFTGGAVSVLRGGSAAWTTVLEADADERNENPAVGAAAAP